MKKRLLFFALAILSIMTAFSQKKPNGSVYIAHPAIDVINEFTRATVSGDSLKLASFLTDDFRSYNGTSRIYDDSGSSKKAFLRGTLRYKKEFDYFAMDSFPGSYPDAIEYMKDNKEQEVWVQTWSVLKGVHKTTGVKLNAAAHRLYKLTKDNKIKMILNYSDGTIPNEIEASFANRTNGKIYNHHDNINTVRKSMYAFEKGDLDKSLAFYSSDAAFTDINSEYGKSETVSEVKASWQKFLGKFEIKSIDMVGYPDYLEYEMNDGREVLSWWKYNLVRKSDKKAIPLLVHISDSFDEKGKIVAEVVYYSESLLSK
jgi:hypothetical protein